RGSGAGRRGVAAHSGVLVFRVWVVDGVGASLQRGGRHAYADVDQRGVLLADPDSVVVVAGDSPWVAGIRGVLGGVRIRDRRGAFYAVAVLARQLEENPGLTPSTWLHQSVV